MILDLLNSLLANAPDIIAFTTGTLGVWLTIKQNIWCWPMALVSVLISGIVFFNQKLYGDMSLQVVYFFAGVYGWIYWYKHLNTSFRIEKTPLSNYLFLVGITLLQAVIYYFLINAFNGDKPLFDAVLTAGSITATYMMTKKWLENWAVWVLIDGAYVALYGIKGMWWFCLLYLLFTVMAAFGWIKWRKTV